jgi:hypothetical protein
LRVRLKYSVLASAQLAGMKRFPAIVVAAALAGLAAGSGCGLGGSSGSTGLSATQLRIAYNAQPLLDSHPSINGSGQTVAIFAEGGFAQANVDSFNRNDGLPVLDSKSLTISVPNGVSIPCGQGLNCQGWKSAANQVSGVGAESEDELDIEAVHAMAPGAAIHVYEGADTADDPRAIDPSPDALASFALGVAKSGEHVASISFGSCESQYVPELNALTTRFQDLAVNHVSVFAATGDHGEECPSVPNSTLSRGPAYPADDPSVTAVGGTYLELNSDNTIKDEQAWDNTGPLASGVLGSSGGGESTLLPRPPWQVGWGDNPAGKTRLVPDVAAEADPGLDAVTRNGNHAGNSLSAPLWAGIAALYNQYAASQHAPPLGLANPMLYGMAASPALVDVTASQNSGPDLATPLPQTEPGWDASTGLGTPNVYAIVHDGVKDAALPAAPPTPEKAKDFPCQAALSTNDLESTLAKLGNHETWSLALNASVVYTPAIPVMLNLHVLGIPFTTCVWSAPDAEAGSGPLAPPVNHISVGVVALPDAATARSAFSSAEQGPDAGTRLGPSAPGDGAFLDAGQQEGGDLAMLEVLSGRNIIEVDVNVGGSLFNQAPWIPVAEAVVKGLHQ